MALLDVFEAFATNEKAELEGVEISLGGDGYVTVARDRNDNYLKRILEEGDANREVLDMQSPESKELDKRLTNQVLAETVFLGFRGLSLKGEPLDDTVDNRVRLLQIPDFRRKIITESQKRSHYAIKCEAKDAKD